MGQALEAAGYSDSGTDVPDVVETDSLAQGEAGSSPAAEPSSAAAPPDATPRVSSPSPEPTPNSPVPFDDHDRVVKSFHAKLDAANESLKSLSWAQQIPAGMGPRLLAMAQRVNGDPVGFVMELAAEIQQNPQHAAALKSHAARLLGQRQGPALQAPAEIPAEARSGVPEVDAVLEARDRWLTQSLVAQVADVLQERLGPITAITGRIQATEQEQAAMREANAFADREFAQIKDRPGFMEHREAIAQEFETRMAQIPEDQQNQYAASVLRDVYLDIAIPKLTSTANQGLLGKLTAKAAAGSLSTSPTVASTPQRPRSMAEAFKQAGVA